MKIKQQKANGPVNSKEFHKKGKKEAQLKKRAQEERKSSKEQKSELKEVCSTER